MERAIAAVEETATEPAAVALALVVGAIEAVATWRWIDAPAPLRFAAAFALGWIATTMALCLFALVTHWHDLRDREKDHGPTP